MALALGGYAGFHTTTPPTAASAYGVFWPALVPAGVVRQVVVLPDGSRRVVPHTMAAPDGDQPTATQVAAPSPGQAPGQVPAPPPGQAPGKPPGGLTVRTPLGRVVGARSGDKGGNANVGLWARRPGAFGWLREALTVQRFRELLPEAAGLQVRRYELPNLHALNFVVVGLLGEGVAAATRPDPQAKGLGEYLRSRHMDIPAALLDEETM
jgi:hypothetical protein